MKRYVPDGKKIKQLRESREHAATQKEFAHEVRISERLLRQIENKNADVTAEVLNRIAKALAVVRQSVILGAEATNSAPAAARPAETAAAPESAEGVLMPRFDTDIANVVRDEGKLLGEAKDSHVIVSHILTKLSADTEEYAEELLQILDSVTWERRWPSTPFEGREELALRRRIRQLLVHLRGNDVWVYMTRHFKRLPETDQIPVEQKSYDQQAQTVIAFGPPGEYGEETLRVPVDHGQPWILKRFISLPQLRDAK